MKTKIINITKDTSIYKDILKNKEAYPSDFCKELNSDFFYKVEEELNRECVNDKSIYDKCIKSKHNGLNVCILDKGEYLYKAMHGFVTQKMNDEYLKTHRDEPYWFGNIYRAYILARSWWSGLIPYKLEKKLIFFDYYDTENLNKIVEFVKNKYGVNSQYYNYIILYTGYKISDTDQLNTIINMTKWPEVWKFNDIMFEPQSGRYCNYETVKLNPVSRIQGMYHVDKILLKMLFDEFLKEYNIDGIIRKQVKTTIELYGLTDEEIIIKGDIFEQKLSFDLKHPAFWGNWKIKNFTIPQNGINMSVALENKNNHFQILKFYLNNDTNTTNKIIPKSNQVSLLTYNVHGWVNINGDINKFKNYQYIINFIKNSDCDIVLLQEVDIKIIKTHEIIQKMKSNGYNDCIYGPNGAPIKKNQNSLIMAFSKKAFQNKSVIDLTVHKFKRCCLLFTYQNIKFAGVHLEVGYSYDYVNKNSDTAIKIIKKNTQYRKDQLSKLLTNDIIFGDFNFDLHDDECSWLRKDKKFGLVDDETPTNPFNTRTDMIFINLESKIVATFTQTLKYNYSDHLPVITTIKNQM